MNFLRNINSTLKVHALADEAGASAPAVVLGASFTSIEEKIKRLAEKEGSDISEAVLNMMQAKEDWEGGPFKVYFAMEKTYTEEELSEFPEPGLEGGNNPDVYYTYKKNAKGEQVKRKTSFYAQFADATKEGKALLEQKKLLELAGQEGSDKTNIPQEIKELSDLQRSTLLAKVEGRRATIRKAYKSAMDLRYQFQKVNIFPNVQVLPQYADENENSVVESQRCIIMSEHMMKDGDIDPAKAPIRWKALTKGSFMRLNANVARELVAGGMKAYDALEKTLTKEKGEGEDAKNKDKNKPQNIATVETFEARMTDIHEYVARIEHDKTNGPAMLKALEKRMNGPGSDEIVESMGYLFHFLERFFKQDKYAVRYETLINQADD